MTPPVRQRSSLVARVALGALALAAGFALVGARPAGAELVVLEDGRFFKVTGYELAGHEARLTLPEGGRVVLPLARVAHVVDDEWVPPPPEPEPSAGAALAGRSWHFDESHPVPQVPYGEQIYEAAKRHGVDPRLVAAVIGAESDYEVRALSPKGARGLMQLMPATALRFGVTEDRIHDPASNLDAGTRYLAWLLDRFDGNLALALAGYNAGEGTVDRYGGVPPYRETRGYLQRIFGTLGLDASRVASSL